MGVTGYRSSRLKIGREGLGEPATEEDAAYAGWYRTMNAIFGGAIALAIILVLVDEDTPWQNRLTGTALILFLLVWFWRRGQWSDIHSDMEVVLYFSVVIVVTVIAIRQHNAFALALFAIYWQGFAYLRIPAALVFTTILTLACQWSFGNLRFSGRGDFIPTPTILLIASIALVVSGLLASYIETISREAERRAALLRQLREAQQELAAREREAGVTLERQRLAGEIHDTIAQHFTSILTNLEAAETRFETSPDAAEAHLANARSAARQGLQDARSMLHALQPHILQGRSLSEALRQVARDADAATDARVAFHEEGPPAAVGRLQESMLVRGLQEALQNARKHANATRVDVTLTWLPDELLLDIEDDGSGFDPGSVPVNRDGHHMGLASMRARVEQAGGTWMIDSTPGEGTSLAISFPLDRGGTGDNDTDR